MSAAFYPQVQEIYIAYYGRPADPAGLQYWAGQLAANRGNLASIINAFGTSAESNALYAGATNAAKVTAIYQQIFNRAPDTAGLNFYTAALTAGTMTAASIALNVADGATGVDATYLANKMTVAQAFSDALTTDSAANLAYTGTTAATAARALITGVTTSAATTNVASTISTIKTGGGGSVAGQTFTLTTGIDAFVGGSGNDTFQGDSAHIGGLDVISGGDGVDTLSLFSTAAAATLSASQITGIERLNFNAGTAAHTVTLGALTGITNVSNSGSTVALTIGVGANSLASAAGIAISNTAQNTTVVHQEAAVTGSADAVSVTLNGVTGAAQVNVDTQTATATVAGAFEVINVISSGATNSVTLETNDTQGLGRVNVSGSSAITIALGTNAAVDAIILDASAATGAVTLTGIGAGNNFAGTAVGHTITGGSANDSFTLGANYIGAEATVASGTRDIINGGAGTDTVSMTIARAVAASTTNQTNLTSIEGLTISDAITGTLAPDITRFTDVTALTIAAAIDAAYTGTITVNSGTSVTLGADAAANSTVTFAVGGTSTADSLTMNMAGFDFLGTGTETFTGVETLNVNTGSTVTGAAVFAAATTLTQSAGSTGSTIVATGVNGLTFTGVVTGASLIDASALTGVLTVTAAPAAALTIRGGSANDVVNGSAAADLLVGGAGDDTLGGAAGSDVIQGGDGADAITGGDGADNLTGGAGIDTFIFNGTAGAAANGADGAAVAEVITDFVAGTDKLQFTGVTDVVSGQQAAVQAAVTALASTSTDAQIATAMAAANTTNLGVSFAVFGGSTYVYYETTGATATHVAIDNIFIKLTGVTTAPTFAADVTA